MLLGRVGQACWHCPQPVQPSRTLIFMSSTISARAPTGQTSTQIVQSSPAERRQVDSCHCATPMSMKSATIGSSAPLGQLCMQDSGVHITQADSSGSM